MSALLAAALCACEAGEDEEQARLRERCAQIFACDCRAYPHADIDACVEAGAVTYAGLRAEYAAAGLVVDEACIARAQAPDPDSCLTVEAYVAAHPELEGSSTLCGVCSFASGERGAGEPCIAFPGEGSASDCAPGLICGRMGPASGHCVDPCLPIGAGLPCGPGLGECADDLRCDAYGGYVCVPAARPGEACSPGQCVAGHTCSLERCVPYAEAGESCAEVYCNSANGLTCGADDVCVPRAQLGEPCAGVACVDGLFCDPVSDECEPPGPVGDLCGQDSDCEVGLHCEEERCNPGRGPGEPCSSGSEPCRLDLSCIDDVCEPGQGLVCE